ncbi:MAG: protein-export chaperone SecB [Gammaproteobacteria bacterium]|nr:protein-export chaperone SecB [Gammaproteobacteria bacterium]
MTEINNNPIFEINRVYTQDLSFESPKAPAIFKQESKFSVDVTLDTRSSFLEAEFYDVVLSITVTAKDNTSKEVVYIAETKQAGIFTLKNFSEEQRKEVSSTLCANILFPYAREVLSNVITRGGFPPLYLAPVNFDALYAQQQKSREEKTLQ